MDMSHPALKKLDTIPPRVSWNQECVISGRKGSVLVTAKNNHDFQNREGSVDPSELK